jgi:ankyrin repeat protein
VPAGAHETDQFTAPAGWRFADLSDELTAMHYDAIAEGVRKLNDRIREWHESPRNDAGLDHFHTQDALAAAVYREFGAAFFAIEYLEWHVHKDQSLKAQHPGRITGHWESVRNLYQNLYFPLDPRLIWRLWHASTMYVHGSYFGPDKIGHFNDMGYVYFMIYRGAIEDGLTEREALDKALDEGKNGFVFGERGLLGYYTAGAYSNADLAANWVGLKFYRNLTEPVRLKGRLEPPLVVRDGIYWKLNDHVRRDSDFLAVFMSDHFDEALNPSLWDSGMRDSVRKAVKARSERVLEFYVDDNGNRRPAAYFEALVEELKTYYGEEYGYHGTYAELVAIGNTCLVPLPADAAPDARAEDGTTPLHQAARDGDTGRAVALLRAGLDVDVPLQSLEQRSSEWGSTPLHVAAEAGQLEMAGLLLDRGADPNRGNTRGATPLHKAVAHPDIVRLLIDRGADVNARDETGRTPLHWLARYPNLDSARLLTASGADVDAADHDGETPLHRAAMWGHGALIRSLLDQGASVAARADYGTTVMHFAVRQGDPAVIHQLLDAGADINATDEFGLTPLHMTARDSSWPMVDTLVAAGAAVRVADAYGTTPLHLAVRNSRESTVATLLAAGADIGAPTRSGAQPLHEAAFVGRTSLVTMLLDHGARPDATDNRGQSPLELAQARGNTLAALLLSSSLARHEALVKRRNNGTSSPFGLP